MGGLLAATALTLLFLPALYAAWFRVQKPESDDAGGPEKVWMTSGTSAATPSQAIL